MTLKIRMHKANNGDCFSIKSESEFILIDGGTAQSFEHWKGQIIGKVDKIDALIVTHIDNDHVNGIIKLLMDPECPPIEQVFFNGAEQLFGSLSEDGQADHRADIKLQALSGECSDIGNKEPIGSSEGTSLSYVISSKGINCNVLALYREKCKSFDIGSLTFTLIGPTYNSLTELKRIWEIQLEQRNIKPRIISKPYYDAFEQYVSNVIALTPNNHEISSTENNSVKALANTPFEDDNSPTNKSSFSFLIESNDKRILYLGDCHTGAVTSWLDLEKLETIHVDIVKISHHGSKNNTSLDLLRRIKCNKYLISTNGKSHGHPNLETLARIALVNADINTEIHLNYKLETIPKWFINELNVNYPSITLLMNSYEIEL